MYIYLKVTIAPREAVLFLMYTWENKIQRDEITCSPLFSPAVIPDVLLGRKDSLTKTDIAFEEPKFLGWEWEQIKR